MDSLSGFGSADEDSGLFDMLMQNKIGKVYLAGVAFDFSLGYTAEDAAEEGFETYVVKDATRSVDSEDE